MFYYTITQNRSSRHLNLGALPLTEERYVRPWMRPLQQPLRGPSIKWPNPRLCMTQPVARATRGRDALPRPLLLSVPPPHSRPGAQTRDSLQLQPWRSCLHPASDYLRSAVLPRRSRRPQRPAIDAVFQTVACGGQTLAASRRRWLPPAWRRVARRRPRRSLRLGKKPSCSRGSWAS